jgi:ElaB/YqjD/DUF883 family membrane-anchored ribosome-binding protein
MARNLDKELQDVRTDLNRLRGDFDDVKETSKREIENLRGKFEAEARDLLDRLRSGVGEARERSRHFVEEARDRGGHAVETVEETIEDRPFVSVLAAFGIGVLIGTLLGRR